MGKKILALGLWLVLSLGSVMAQALDLASMMKNVQLDKSEIERMVRHLQNSGQITKEQADMVISDLKGLSESDIAKLKNQAIQKIQNSSSGPTSKALEEKVKKQLEGHSKQEVGKKSPSFNLKDFQ